MRKGRNDMGATRLVYERSDGRWAWRLTSEDHRVLASGTSQGFDTEKEARIAADEVVGGHYSAATKRRRPAPAVATP